MNLRKIVLSGVLAGAALCAAYLAFSQKEPKQEEQRQEQPRTTFLEKAQRTYSEYEQRLEDLKKEYPEHNLGIDDSGIKFGLEYTFTTVDKLNTTENLEAKAICKTLPPNIEWPAKSCKIDLGDIEMVHQAGRGTGSCRLLIKVDKDEKVIKYTDSDLWTTKGNREDPYFSFYTGADFWDSRCDGTVDRMNLVYATANYGDFMWEREQDPDFFEKTADPFWAKMIKLFK